MTLEILSASPMLSVQDAGRRGLRGMGVSASGPMDPPALALANALCANPADAAALEFAAFGGQVRTDAPVRFAVTGGMCDIRIADRILAPDESHWLHPDETLTLGALRGASWGYFAVAGGIDTPPVLGSRSTHLRFALGGLDGRRLGAGDRLPIGAAFGDTLLRLAVPVPARRFADPVRILPGPQDGSFSDDVLARLTTSPFTVTDRRDRMAFVLDGPDLPARHGHDDSERHGHDYPARHGHDIVSDGTMPGAIQVPGTGKPMVLMAECQTTGGYPKIATVISADLARLAQMPVGTTVRFATMTRDAAEDAARIAHAARAALIASLTPKADRTLSSEYLLSCDLVGGFHDPEAVTGGPA